MFSHVRRKSCSSVQNVIKSVTWSRLAPSTGFYSTTKCVQVMTGSHVRMARFVPCHLLYWSRKIPLLFFFCLYCLKKWLRFSVDDLLATIGSSVFLLS